MKLDEVNLHDHVVKMANNDVDAMCECFENHPIQFNLNKILRIVRADFL